MSSHTPIPSNSPDSYYIKEKQVWSCIGDTEIRSEFEKYITNQFRHKIDLSRAISGCYNDDYVQTRWEVYYNGFRRGEALAVQ